MGCVTDLDFVTDLDLVTDVVTDLDTKIFYSEVLDTVTPTQLMCSKKATYP